MTGRLFVLVAGLLAIASCREAQPEIKELVDGLVAPTGSAAPAEPAPESGRALFERYECARCHRMREVAALPLMKRCVDCHESIEAGSFRDASDEVLAEWQRRMHSLPSAPSLDASGPLLSTSWVASYLLEPHDLRPDLEATMPRLVMTEAEAYELAAFVTRDHQRLPLAAGETPDPSLAERGRALFGELGCAQCHAFGGSDATAAMRDATTSPVALAPDLRFTRERVRPERLVSWLASPHRTRLGGAMPAFSLADGQAEAVASYILHAPLSEPEPVAVPERLPVLERPVGYDEVEERVFRKICWHCHAQPDLARGDGGPGMSGGMGFAARRLDLSTYESINSGYLDDEGELTSLFAATEDGTPRLVAVLLARQREVAGEHGAIRGMPLGFSPLSPQDLQLVETWVAQGRPR